MTNAICVYDFTLGKDFVELENLKKWLNANCKKWSFQLEKGESGYEHYQGRFSLKTKLRLSTLKKRIEVPQIHLSPTSEDNCDNMFYVTKTETRISGPWSDKDIEIYIPRQYRGLVDNLHPFQKTIWDSYDIFDTRNINIIIDTIGNIGKSVIASLLELYGRGHDLPCVNDGKELIQSACDWMMDNQIRVPGVFTMDLPRAMKQKQLRGIYTALEQIKKGKVVDMRYHYRQWWFDSPQIWVFTNCQPKLKYLSMDRWRIWSVEPDTLTLIPYNE